MSLDSQILEGYHEGAQLSLPQNSEAGCSLISSEYTYWAALIISRTVDINGSTSSFGEEMCSVSMDKRKTHFGHTVVQGNIQSFPY